MSELAYPRRSAVDPTSFYVGKMRACNSAQSFEKNWIEKELCVIFSEARGKRMGV